MDIRKVFKQREVIDLSEPEDYNEVLSRVSFMKEYENIQYPENLGENLQ